MKKLIIALTSLLTGCGGITTKQIVALRKTQHELKAVNSELTDNLQASLWGMNYNKNEQTRDEFKKVAFQIAGEPSFEEKQFAENASINDVIELKNETKSFLKQKEKLQERLTNISEGMTSSHSKNGTFNRLFLMLGGCVLLVVFLSYIYSKVPFL